MVFLFSSEIMIAKIFWGKSNNFLECENTWLINIHTTKKGIFYYYIKKVFEYKRMDRSHFIKKYLSVYSSTVL